MALLIDSSVFIALERRRLSLSALTSTTGPELLSMASISVSELLVGVLRANSVRRRMDRQAASDEVFRTIPILSFDLRAARVHAETGVELAASGQMIGSHDLIIAATALAHGYDVLTENVRDFGRVPGLGIRRPNWPS